MDVIIIIFCETGFGDQYSSIITGLNCLHDLRKLGIEPKVIVSKGHKYFSKDVNLDVIYNFNSFDCDIRQVNFNEVENITKGYELILFTSIQIWSKGKTQLLEEYKQYHKYINRNNRNLSSIEPILDLNLIQKDIIDESDKITKNKKNIIGIHIRGGDENINSDINTLINDSYWGHKIKIANKIIEEYSENDIMICSINRKVCDFFSKNYSNVFFYVYPNEKLPMHNIVNNSEKLENIDDYINHSKIILSEMVSFSKCIKIWSYNYFPSNFVLYGIINNINYDNWLEKIKTSMI